jgi:hypothetical protein
MDILAQVVNLMEKCTLLQPQLSVTASALNAIVKSRK